MASYVFTGGYPTYYPTTGLFAKPGETHELAAAPDGNWTLATASAPVPAAPVTQPDSIEAAEALLEANPALAEQIVREAAKNA